MTPLTHRTDGDGWIDCDCGQRHWGLYGSAGLLLADPDHGVLLQHRAVWSHHGGTWGVPGGARAAREPALAGAIREAGEEAAVPVDGVRPSHAWIEDHGPWSYTTVVASTDAEFEPYASDPESLEISWVPVDDVDALPLHPGFGRLWPSIRTEVFRRLVLVVDAANVVGSRPDGWWRDRAGAAARLRDRLAGSSPLAAKDLGLPATCWWPQVRLVVEGEAREIDDVVAHSSASLEVLIDRAAGSGDDSIVAVAQDAISERPDDHVVVVTADRELRYRAERSGAATIGPATLNRLLE